MSRAMTVCFGLAAAAARLGLRSSVQMPRAVAPTPPGEATTTRWFPRGPVPWSAFPLLPLTAVTRRVRLLKCGGELEEVLPRRHLPVGQLLHLQVLHPIIRDAFKMNECL